MSFSKPRHAFVDGELNFEFTKAVIDNLITYSFCEAYDMEIMDTMLRHRAFAHRNRTKAEIESESDDRLKHWRVKVDTFGQVRDVISTVGVDGVRTYKLERSKTVPTYGRVYDTDYAILAYTQSHVRAVALNGTVEIDQQGCHPRNFLRLYTETFGKVPPATTFLVENKHKFVTQALLFYSLPDNQDTRGLIKTIVLAMTYAGTLGSAFKLKGNKKKRRKAGEKPNGVQETLLGRVREVEDHAAAGAVYERGRRGPGRGRKSIL